MVLLLWCVVFSVVVNDQFLGRVMLVCVCSCCVLMLVGYSELVFYCRLSIFGVIIICFWLLFCEDRKLKWVMILLMFLGMFILNVQMLYWLCCQVSGLLLVVICRLVSLLIGLVGEWLLGIYCGYSRVIGLGLVGMVVVILKMCWVRLCVFILMCSSFGVVVLFDGEVCVSVGVVVSVNSNDIVRVWVFIGNFQQWRIF